MVAACAISSVRLAGNNMTNRIHQNGDPDWAIRAQALERLAISTGGPIPWAEISKGFLERTSGRMKGASCSRHQSPARGDAVPDEWPRPYASIGERERSIGERERSLHTARRRNHQAWFSKHVRSVYGYRCAFSNLPLGKLLVGAHIKADEEGGPASVSNGICMSTLHHAAFDSYLIGVDPNLKIHVSRSIFDADDGPLLASLQGLDGATLRVPQMREARPDRGFLEWRFEKFRAVQG